MKTSISITIDEELLQKLKTSAQKHYTNVSQEIRNIVRKYFEEHKDD